MIHIVFCDLVVTAARASTSASLQPSGPARCVILAIPRWSWRVWILVLIAALGPARAETIDLPEPKAIPRGAVSQAEVESVLREASAGLPAGLREILAGKPSPYLVKAHDVGPATDFDTDIPWHALDKEKDARFQLPHFGKLGLVNANSDVNLLVGMAVEPEATDFKPPRRYTDHLINLIGEEVTLSGVRAHLLFLPARSNTVLTVIEARNTTPERKLVRFECVCTKSPNAEEPFDRYGYGIHVTTGKLQWAGYNSANRAVVASFEEWSRDRRQQRVGSLLCTMTGSEPPISFDSTVSPDAASATLRYGLDLVPGGSRLLVIALNLHRFGAQRFEARNQSVLYPQQTPAEACEASIRAAVDALSTDWPALVRDSFKWYERMPIIRLPEPSWTADLACAMELPRGNTWSAQGQLAQPWYTFCRVHGHNPYGWWSYGMHAHEHLSTFVTNLTQPSLSQSYLRGHFQAQQPDGSIQYGVNHRLQDEHPGLATCPLLMWESLSAYAWSGDRPFLEQAYAAGSRYLRWWRSPARTREGIPLQHWKDYLETVRDDRDLATWTATGTAEQQEALDLNCYLLNEESSLAAMARELGKADEAAAWEADAQQRQAHMQRQLWHAQDRVYYGRDLASGQWAGVMDISTFLPLWCGLATPEQVPRLVGLLHDPDAFGTDYPVATLAVRQMPEKRRGVHHWRGSNWVEMTWLVIGGLQRCGHEAEAARIAEINSRMVFKTLEDSGHFREFYNSLTGEPSDLTDYIWTSIPAAMAVEVFFGIHPTTAGLEVRPAMPQGWPEMAIHNLRIRGSTLSLTIRRDREARQRTVTVNGHLRDTDARGGVFLGWRDLPPACTISILQPP